MPALNLESPVPDHAQHGHGTHHHHAGGSVHHAPAPDALGAYTMAHDAARPAPGGRVVTIDLEAAELYWEFAPGRSTRAWGYNGQVPGPVLEANVGGVLAVRLTNRLAEPTTIH